MLRRLWQRGMIGLAGSPTAKRLMQHSRAGRALSARYNGGATAAQVVESAERLLGQGLRASLFYLGEYVSTRELVDLNLREIGAAVAAVAHGGADAHVSVDPTQIGHGVDDALLRPNALTIATAIAAIPARPGRVRLMMLDMEDASLNDPTIALHDELKDRGLPVGVTVQAYLRRTEADLARLIVAGATVRLVKGAFVAGSDISFSRQDEIKDNYRKLMAMMLSPAARAAGFYPIIATHDDTLHEEAVVLARANGWRPHDYEFEMLMGVRSDVAARLAARGERVRLYLPFGVDWFPYAMRRIGENPRNGVLLARSLLG
ncbi:MAG TPA: proline dehydrogenase family protein [Aestuariivirga sp.]|nr:proline dehydrogenase family protein [Aestuariivirga sp.]